MSIRFFAWRAIAVSASLAALVQVTALAQQPGPINPPRRLPPTGSQSNAIPAGVDTGSPTTSNALPLGTPVPPAGAADRVDQNKRSAAARAAGRPGSAPSIDDRVPAGPAPLGAQTERSEPTATAPRSQRPAPRRGSAALRADCATTPSSAGTPVALPNSGFLGSSASPGAASAVARGAARSGC